MKAEIEKMEQITAMDQEGVEDENPTLSGTRGGLRKVQNQLEAAIETLRERNYPVPEDDHHSVPNTSPKNAQPTDTFDFNTLRHPPVASPPFHPPPRVDPFAPGIRERLTYSGRYQPPTGYQVFRTSTHPSFNRRNSTTGGHSSSHAGSGGGNVAEGDEPDLSIEAFQRNVVSLLDGEVGELEEKIALLRNSLRDSGVAHTTHDPSWSREMAEARLRQLHNQLALAQQRLVAAQHRQAQLTVERRG